MNHGHESLHENYELQSNVLENPYDIAKHYIVISIIIFSYTPTNEITYFPVTPNNISPLPAITIGTIGFYSQVN